MWHARILRCVPVVFTFSFLKQVFLKRCCNFTFKFLKVYKTVSLPKISDSFFLQWKHERNVICCFFILDQWRNRRIPMRRRSLVNLTRRSLHSQHRNQRNPNMLPNASFPRRKSQHSWPSGTKISTVTGRLEWMSISHLFYKNLLLCYSLKLST